MNNSKTTRTVKTILLELERRGQTIYDISHRGGTYGAWRSDAVSALFPTISYDKREEIEGLLPIKIGAFCNYLGGGLRGGITRSDYSKELPAKYAKRIDSFTRECKRRYEELENGEGLNNEEYEDGDTNWEAIGTNKCRANGVVSGY